MTIIVIDPGHGGVDPGASYRGFQEKNYNLSIALKVRSFLQENYNVTILMTRSTDTTVSLQQRSELANSRNADLFLSIHNNGGGGRGFESYIYDGAVPQQTITFQDIIHNEIISSVRQKYSIIDRGQKRANFHVLRETEMSALLLELLFVDNAGDLAILNNPSYIADISTAIGRGVARALSLPVKNPPSGTLYKVIAGSFTIRQNAEDRVNLLNSRGISAFIVPTLISGRQFFRVQAGAFSSRANAEAQAERVEGLGIVGPFIIRE